MPTSPPASPASTFRLVLENAGQAQLDAGVTTLGQVFQAGDLGKGQALVARIGGTAVPVQMDVKATYPDGSVKMAVLSFERPPLAAGASLAVTLEKAAAPAAQPAVNLAAVSAQHTLTVEIAPVGQARITIDVLDALRKALADGSASVWQQGPLATQARVELDLPGSMRVLFDVTAFKDGQISVDAMFNNDEAMLPVGGRVVYDVVARLNGREVIRERVDQAQYQNWHREFESSEANGGQGLGDPGRGWLNIKHDIAYLKQTGAVLNYDLSMPIATSLLEGYGRAIASAEWGKPLAANGVAQYMPGTGDRPDIGFTTDHNAAWLLSGDARAAAYALGQAEAAGAVPWNHWDTANRTWLNTDNYPRIWTETLVYGGIAEPGNPRSNGLTQPRPGAFGPDGIGWQPDQAHQPDLSFVPYILTGERWILDNLNAQSYAAIVGSFPGFRDDGSALIVRGGQVRGSAWNLRQIENAAWINPDGSAEKAFFGRVSERNWAWLLEQIPGWTAQQGEVHGYLPGWRTDFSITPWQQDMFAGVVILSASRGNEAARSVIEWMSNFLVGRFTAEAKGFSPRDGIAYVLAVGDETTGARYKTWAEIGAGMVAQGLSSTTTESGWGRTDPSYGRLSLATLAGLYDLLGDPAIAAIYRARLADRQNGTDEGTYGRQPATAITIPAIYDEFYPPAGAPAPAPQPPPVTPAPQPPPPPDMSVPPPAVPKDEAAPPKTFAPKSVTLGQGADTLVLKIAQDHWLGDAAYTIAVNGVQIGGVQTASALKSSGLADTVTVKGDWGSSSTVSVTFVNDAWGGAVGADRNLHVLGASLNGKELPGAAKILFDNGSFSFPAPKTFAPKSVTLGQGADTLVLKIAQDHWLGDAAYTIAVNGVQIGGVQTASALKSSGLADTVTVKGDWGSSSTVSVTFVNDAWGGAVGADRNLHVLGASLNGKELPGAAKILFDNGSFSFPAQKAAAVSATIVGTAGPNRLFGTAGDDIIRGGGGNDVMVGRAGADTFVFARGDGADRIVDFVPGVDRLLFEGIAPASVKVQPKTIDGTSGLLVTYGTGADSVFLANVAKLAPGDLVFG